MKRRIHPFKVHGKALDVETVYRLKASLIDVQIAEMRERGYVPVVDSEPEVLTKYLGETETFEYEITVAGVYVGKRRAKQIYCVRQGTFVYARGGDEGV